MSSSWNTTVVLPQLSTSQLSALRLASLVCGAPSSDLQTLDFIAQMWTELPDVITVQPGILVGSIFLITKKRGTKPTLRAEIDSLAAFQEPIPGNLDVARLPISSFRDEFDYAQDFALDLPCQPTPQGILAYLRTFLVTDNKLHVVYLGQDPSASKLLLIRCDQDGLNELPDSIQLLLELFARIEYVQNNSVHTLPSKKVVRTVVRTRSINVQSDLASTPSPVASTGARTIQKRQTWKSSERQQRLTRVTTAFTRRQLKQSIPLALPKRRTSSSWVESY